MCQPCLLANPYLLVSLPEKLSTLEKSNSPSSLHVGILALSGLWFRKILSPALRCLLMFLSLDVLCSLNAWIWSNRWVKAEWYGTCIFSLFQYWNIFNISLSWSSNTCTHRWERGLCMSVFIKAFPPLMQWPSIRQAWCTHLAESKRLIATPCLQAGLRSRENFSFFLQ